MDAMHDTNTPDRPTLEHENWIAYLTGTAAHCDDVEVARVGGAVAIRSDVPFDWLNQVLVERDDATTGDVLAAAAAVAGVATPPLIRLREGADDRHVEAIIAAGWRVAGPETLTPGMVAHPIDHLAAAPAAAHGLRIRRITDQAGILEHRDVVRDGFGVAPSVTIAAAGFGLLDVPECTVYLGEADGVPVTSGIGWRTGRTIGVYAISTIPSARRRGFGEAMTARVVAEGIAAGCDVAVLQASVVGRPIYERLGFRADVQYAAYVRS